MHERTLTRTLLAATAFATSAFLTYAFTHSADDTQIALQSDTASAGSGVIAGSSAAELSPRTAAATTPVVDLDAWLHPAGKYLGVVQDGVPNSMTGLTRLSREIGERPDMVEYYVPWGEPLNQTWVLNLADDGILPLIQFEPQSPTMARIAAGASDAYAADLAQTIKALNVPAVFSFGHEMNGDWYVWGTQRVAPADFVKAWRRIHDIFTAAGATNVIWLWDANVTYPVPNTPLEPLYPGDAYVDWIGLTGYYNATAGGRRTFDTLFEPTMEQVRRFSAKPFLIAETAASPSRRKPAEIRDLFTAVEDHSDVLGFVWFDCAKTGAHEADWRIDSDPVSAATFGSLARSRRWATAGRP